MFGKITKELKNNRFNCIVLSLLFLSVVLSFALDKLGLNLKLSNYSEFVSDILNTVSILTGFLGTLIGIVTAIPGDSLLIKKITGNKIVKGQFYFSLFAPFILGTICIVLSLYFKLYLLNKNQITFIFWGALNWLFIFSIVLFVLFFIFSASVSLWIVNSNQKINRNIDENSEIKIKEDEFNI